VQPTLDKLTGLYQEKYFTLRVEEEIARSTRYKRPLTLLCLTIDYDHFIKDYDIRWTMSYSIIKQFGALLARTSRNVDLPGRFSGDSFMLLLPETGEEGARIAAERLRQRVEQHVFIGDEQVPEVHVAVSVGVAVFPQHGKTTDELYSGARKAMLTARQRGGNCVELCPHVIHDGTDEDHLPIWEKTSPILEQQKAARSASDQPSPSPPPEQEQL